MPSALNYQDLLQTPPIEVVKQIPEQEICNEYFPKLQAIFKPKEKSDEEEDQIDDALDLL